MRLPQRPHLPAGRPGAFHCALWRVAAPAPARGHAEARNILWLLHLLLACLYGVVARAAPPQAQQAALASGSALVFTAQMYGLQLDQLAVLLARLARPADPARRARALVTRWRSEGLADSAVLGPGPAWVWVTRAGLRACGLRYAAAPPALARLAHIRAVTAVRLALEAVPGYRAGAAYWRAERQMRARLRIGAPDHLPDAEVHWPDGSDADFAGECWAIEAELTPKTIARTATIMRGLLARTGDYGCPAADASVPGLPPRYDRAVYLCSPAATGTVLRARAAMGGLGDRVEIRVLPAGAALGSGP